jgi:hypothetical protein
MRLAERPHDLKLTVPDDVINTADVTDGDQLIETTYPPIGPHSPELTESAGAALHQLVRFLNYATLGENRGRALPYASHGYHVAGSLRHAAALQQQLYNQFALWCDELARDPALGHADHRREDVNHLVAMDCAEEAAAAFRAAAGHASGLAAWLQAAQTALGPLYHDAD